ncbi:MAG: DUF2277 domain-containing protein [Acidimicrobiia bacterium]|nr:DUF2277 domain-containing protein [Acidimicrobiia bacterium]
MCRNITPLRGLEPGATDEEVRAAALQFVRKVGSLSSVSEKNRPAVDSAVDAIAEATVTLLDDLPPRRNPPPIVPPNRRR